METMIFDGDDRIAQVGRDAAQGNVAAVFFEREPRLAIGAVKHRLADAARELVDGESVPDDDRRRDEGGDGQYDRGPDGRKLLQRARMPEGHFCIRNLVARQIGRLKSRPRNLRVFQSSNLPIHLAVTAAVRLSGRSSRPMSEPCVRMTARSMTCCSSRTLPGHEKFTSARSASA